MGRAVVVFVVAVLWSPASSRAESPPFETPGSDEFCLFEPFGWQFGFAGVVERTGGDQGYQVTVRRDECASTEPRCTLAGFGAALEAGTGVLFVAAHGGEGCIAIEVYEKSPEGLAARNQAYERYLGSGWWENYIVPIDGSSYWAIAITGFGIMAHFDDENTIVYLAACHSCTAAYGFDEAREVLCYEGTVPIVQVVQDADQFWRLMNGEVSRASRAVAVAAGTLWATLRHYQGPGHTVLSPAVCAASFEDGDHVRTLTGGWVAFDTRMDTRDPEILELEGPILAGEESWVNDTCLVFQIAPYDTALGSMCVSPNARSRGGRVLDGNMNPPGSNARGPSGDPYCLSLYAFPDDPAARWGGLWAFESSEGVRVEWTTETERGSERFDVVGISGDRRDKLAEVPAHGGPNRPAAYSVVVPEGATQFMVSEVNSRGARVASRSFSLEPHPPVSPDCMQILDSLEHRRPARTGSGACRARKIAGSAEAAVEGSGSGAWPRYLFYGPDSLLAEVTPLVDYWSERGIESHLEASTASDPWLLFSYLQGLEAASDSLGLPTPTVIVIGDANEGGEPEKNIVGTLYFPDSNGACYFSDTCPAEHDLADLDFDGLADLNLARIPADRRAEVARSVETYLNFLGGEHASQALFLSGDLDEGDVLAGPLHETLLDIRNLYGGHGIPTVLRNDSEYDWYDNLTRQTDVAGDLNAGVSEIFTMGAISNRSRTPGMFIQKVVAPRWDMDWLVPGPHPFVFWGPGCGMADIDRDNPLYDPPLAEMFLFNDPEKAAAVAWVSHGRGNWSPCHILFARELAFWRLSGFASDVLDCYTRAKNSCATKYPQTRDYVRSLFFLGWPAELSGMGYSGCPVTEDVPTKGLSLESFPNPFNPATTLRYSLAQEGRVRLAVYAVSGQLVIRLVDRMQPPGTHAAVWDGLDSRGRRVSSGVYFARLEVGGHRRTAKVVMAR